MHRNRGGAPRLAGQRHFDGVHLVPGISLADFSRHRHGNGGTDRRDDPPAEFRIPHQSAAAGISGNFRGRTAHVDVDHVGMRLHSQNRRCGHPLGIIAKQLDGGGGTLFIQGQKGLALFVAEAQPLAADHFPYDIGGTEVRTDTAEGTVGHTGHRGERGTPRYLHIPDQQGYRILPTKNFGPPPGRRCGRQAAYRSGLSVNSRISPG